MVLVVIAYPVLGGVLITEKWYFLYIVGVFLLYLMVLLRLKRQAAIPKKCPHCESSLTQCEWTLLLYGRCSNCRRKLVRDGDAEKGGDHA